MQLLGVLSYFLICGLIILIYHGKKYKSSSCMMTKIIMWQYIQETITLQ